MGSARNRVKRLAMQMATVAREIRDHLLDRWDAEQAGALAQVICYEQLAKRLESGEQVSGEGMFASTGFISEEIGLYAQRLQNLLNDHEVTPDVLLYFYEEFLRAYDRETRERRGVYYTPKPVVSYLVQSVDALIKSHFEIGDGLAGDEVQIVDPAVGTGTFLHSVIDVVEGRDVWAAEGTAEFLRARLLPRLQGIELMRAPHVIAQMSLRLRLARSGVNLQEGEPLQIAHGNALAQPMRWGNGSSSQVLVILGNPPYSNFGKLNQNPWIDELLGVYKQGLGEKKQNLSDDYIKFIRLAEWQVEQAGRGIVAFVTNNSFLFGLTHRKMRESLLRTFDELYVLNLHGDQSERHQFERDENVFPITRGVAVVIFVSRGAEWRRGVGETGERTAQVFYQDLVGSRDEKFVFLGANTVETTSWQRLQLRKELYEFVPLVEEFSEEYAQYWSLSNLFLVSNSGIQTKKDRLAIHFDEESLAAVIERLRAGEGETLRAELALGADSSGWRLAAAVKDVHQHEGVVIDVQYRPFDLRKTYYTGRSNGFLGRPRANVTEHLLRPNLALASLRQIVGVPDPCAILATQHMLTDRAMNSRNGTPYVFPLYRYDAQGRRHNLNADFLQALEQSTGLTFLDTGERGREQDRELGNAGTFDAEDVFAYAYAVLNANSFRERYKGLLRRDFPRVPAQVGAERFLALARLGKMLVALHTRDGDMQRANHRLPPCNYVVRSIRYDEPEQRLYINQTKSFANVSPEVYRYRVGGYQVVVQWLKERRGRVLSARECAYFQNLLTRLEEALVVVDRIDEVLVPFLRGAGVSIEKGGTPVVDHQ